MREYTWRIIGFDNRDRILDIIELEYNNNKSEWPYSKSSFYRAQKSFRLSFKNNYFKVKEIKIFP